eukprot:TRINITY_DN37498_c0_g4_i1.p1 TRINITY_DN37498_c0_g4~~TRINITY_DN37498_c0_g4_i1.p1  ORF type:complete len:1431 (-),score=425.50 TRINITY_DN37498_c0_g4_i1:158-4450(-)
MAADDDGPPQGVIVCVRLRPMFIKRPDGTPGREATCQRVVEMEGQCEDPKGCGCAVTKIYDPNDMEAPPRSYAFDRSYWSCDGSKEDPDRPGFRIPDSPDSKYVDQDMVWNDIGLLVMKNAMRGYNCTVFAYGQSGCGKSYSVVGDPPNIGIIPRSVAAVFDTVSSNKDPDIRYNIEIAMLEVYMDEVYDLLEPRKKDRQKLNVFNNKGEVFIYDPKDRKNMDKIWRAVRSHDQAESFRKLGDANRSIRATGMNPESSRGHTLFIVRIRKEVKRGASWLEEFRSKMCLVDLAGSERAHDTGLTGVGLEEGVAINQSLSALGQCLVQLCKGERVNYSDKLTRLLSESLGGNAVTIMIAALSPADINYNDTLSTLRFADNAKKMPVKVKKQLDPTAELIRQLKEENEKLQAQLASMGSEEVERERKEWEEKLAAADDKVAESQKELEELKAHSEQQSRVHMTSSSPSARGEDLRAKSREELEAIIEELEVAKKEKDAKLEELNTSIEDLQAKVQEMGTEAAAPQQAELTELLRTKSGMEAERKEEETRERKTLQQLLEMRLAEIETLQDKRDEARLAVLKAKKAGATDTAEDEAKMKQLEEELAAARTDCESMYDQAAALGIGRIFRAATLALRRQEEQSKASYLQDQLAILQATAENLEEEKRLEEEGAAALAVAQQAAEEAKAAADAALQEKMEQLQAVAAERDDARAEVAKVKERLGSTEEELREKQEAIASIISSEQKSWEEKLKQADEAETNLKKSFEDMGVSVAEMMSIFNKTMDKGFDDKDTPPHFINLSEDSHDQGLLYLIPGGTSKVKQYDEQDQETAIKLDGPSIRPHHATLVQDEAGGVSIASGSDDAVLWVNGQALCFGSAPVALQHGARVIFGSDFVFRFVDPRAQRKRKTIIDKKGTAVIIDWEYAMKELSQNNGVDAEEEIRKVREKMQGELAQREAELEEEQRLLEERMARERQEFESQIAELKRSKTAAIDPVNLKQEQQRTQSVLAKFAGAIDQKRSRAQWVRAAFTAGKDNRFELDVRLSRKQMAELQPRLVEANRIAREMKIGVRYCFHFLDAIDPRARSSDEDLQDEKLAPKRLLLQIQVQHEQKKSAQLWSLQKFRDRFVKMLELTNGGNAADKVKDEDAALFWDDMEHVLVGTAAIGLTPLLSLKSVKEYVTLRSLSGDVSGALEVTMSMELVDKGPSRSLSNKKVSGQVSFGRLNHQGQKWSGFFVRFSWFDTEGRMTHVSPTAQAADLKHTFTFESICNEAFLKFLEQGVMAIQVRAYEKGQASGEVQLLRQQLQSAQDELEKLRRREADDSAWLDVRHGTLEEVKSELVKARAQVFRIEYDKESLKQTLDEIERPASKSEQVNLPGGMPPLIQKPGDKALQEKVEMLERELAATKELERKNQELEARLRSESARNLRDEKKCCEVM